MSYLAQQCIYIADFRAAATNMAGAANYVTSCEFRKRPLNRHKTGPMQTGIDFQKY